MSRSGHLSRRELLLLAAASGCHWWLPACGTRGAPADQALRRGARWLLRQQRADGRFVSSTYGLLAGGHSLTPFVALALLAAPPDDATDAGVARAVQSALGLRDQAGALGTSGPALDYPCYATGMLLSCLAGASLPDWKRSASHSVAWLRAQQLSRSAGWDSHPAQGGWGMGGRIPRTPPHAGHVDLSMTRRVVEGLRAVGVASDDAALREAAEFVMRCQTEDGSFLYSPVELALNKGKPGPEGRQRGYGSATADGLLALRALGRDAEPPARAAHAWLAEHHRPDRNPGVAGGPMAPFAEAMRGYYRAASAAAFEAYGGPAGWSAELEAAIVAEQQPEGLWQNTSSLQKEDDPLIATAFAVQALAAARRAGSQG
jgi:hypothetical protein